MNLENELKEKDLRKISWLLRYEIFDSESKQQTLSNFECATVFMNIIYRAPHSECEII